MSGASSSSPLDSSGKEADPTFPSFFERMEMGEHPAHPEFFQEISSPLLPIRVALIALTWADWPRSRGCMPRGEFTTFYVFLPRIDPCPRPLDYVLLGQMQTLGPLQP